MANRLNTNDIFNTATSAGHVSTYDNEGQVLVGVPWPEHPMFGPDHAKWTAKLAERILQAVFQQRGLGEPSAADMLTIRGAATFHDLGRGLKADQNWRIQEPGHQARSAQMAEQVLRTDAGVNFPAHTHRDICRLITNHKLPPLTGPGSNMTGTELQVIAADPFMVALWDAECLESSRFDPRTEAGLQLTRIRFNQVLSAWAKLPEHRQRWRNERWRRA